MELAIIRVDLRAHPRRPHGLTAFLGLVVAAPGKLDNRLPGNQLRIKGVKVSLRLVSLREGVNVGTNQIRQRRAAGFPADIFQGTSDVLVLGLKALFIQSLLGQR